MITHLSAAETLVLLHAELGEPNLTVVDLEDGPRALSQAIAKTTADPDGGLIAMLVNEDCQPEQVLRWLQRQNHADVERVPVEEGLLLLLPISGRPHRTVGPHLQRWTTHDATPVPNATESDLDDDALRKYLRAYDLRDRRRTKALGTGEERYLASCGLLAHEGQIWRPTVAAMLLCGTRPELFVPGCKLIGDVDGDTSTHFGTPQHILRAFMRGLDTNIDPHIIAEVVHNAFLHRDWSVDAPVTIHLDGDRLEVTNPGTLFRGTPARAKPPNPLLVQLANSVDPTSAQAGLLNVKGRLVRQRRRPFSLFERDGKVHFVAELRRKTRPARRPRPKTTRLLPPAPTTPSTTVPWPTVSPPTPPAEPPPHTPPPVVVSPPPPQVQPRRVVPALLPRDPEDRADAVLAALAARGDASTKELAADLGCSRPVIGKVLKLLVDEGRILPLLASNRSPFQRYAIANP